LTTAEKAKVSMGQRGPRESLDVARPWLRQARHDRGLTMAEFAEAIGMSKAYVSEIERGLRTPAGEMAYRIWEFFGMTFPLSHFYKDMLGNEPDRKKEA
jgi:transcriptional regulator with XRE-family HTH domain